MAWPRTNLQPVDPSVDVPVQVPNTRYGVQNKTYHRYFLVLTTTGGIYLLYYTCTGQIIRDRHPFLQVDTHKFLTCKPWVGHVVHPELKNDESDEACYSNGALEDGWNQVCIVSPN